MKKLILIVTAIFAFIGVSNAQCDMSTKDTTAKESGIDFYVSAGVSMSNGAGEKFSYTSYPSVELGIMKNNFSLGLVVGRGNFVRTGGLDYFSDYWAELKTALYIPVGNFNTYGLIGIGSYFESNKMFIEYGVGFSYSFKKIGVFSQVSNWDGAWYVTPGVSYTF